MEKYLLDTQFVFSRVQHHVHKKCKDGRYELIGWVNNLTDEDYRTYVIPVTSLGFTQNMIAPPRWYGVTLRINWN